MPAQKPREPVRSEHYLHVLPPWEALAREIEGDPSTSDARLDIMPESYKTNTFVQSAIANGEPLPIPITVFADGVRYTSQLSAGKQDSIIGIWMRVVGKERRQLITTIRSKFLCRCGCRGWCTLFVVWSYISQALLQLRRGLRSDKLWDGSPRDPADAYHSCKRGGKELGFKAILLRITGQLPAMPVSELRRGHYN